MVVAIALEGYGPLTVACARTTLGAVTLLILAIAMGRPMPRGQVVWVYLAVTGVLNTALPFALLSWGQQYVPSAFAGISMAVLPLIVLPLAHVFSDEKLSARKTFGVVLGFIGALVLIGPGAFDFSEGSLALPQLACIGASVSYAISSVIGVHDIGQLPSARLVDGVWRMGAVRGPAAALLCRPRVDPVWVGDQPMGWIKGLT